MMILYCRLQIKRHHEKTVTGNFSPPLRYFTCTLCTGQPLDSNYWWFTGNNLRLRIDYLWNHWSQPGIEKRLTAAFFERMKWVRKECEGRAARGERWNLEPWASQNDLREWRKPWALIWVNVVYENECEGRDSNPRTPMRPDPESGAVDLAWLPSL